MQTKPSFFNWSLKKLLATETGSFKIARIKILYFILLLSLLKILLVLALAWYHQQHFQLVRGFTVLALYAAMFKLLLANKSYVKKLTHIMISAGILIVLSVLFISAQSVNIITLQFVFMAILSSFYLLNMRWGIFYSIISCMPVILFLILPDKDILGLHLPPNELAAPGPLIITILNFITIITAHYLYHQAFSTNMAEKEALNIQLKESVEKANKLAQSRSDFLSTMSHELRTPLNAVIGITDLLLDEPANEKQKENLGILKFSAVSLHALINDILDFNKLGSEKLHLERVSVNISELMHNICSGLIEQAKEKGLNMQLDMDDELNNRYVITDPIRITQVIYNLGSNAIKFTKQGSITVSLKLLPSDQQHLRIRFAVADTGIGISADKHENIFEPFVQASTSTTRNYGGTGLGLSIVKRLLILFGSEIHLHSKPGAGSEFFFEISFEPGKAPVKARPAGLQQKGDLSGLRVLIAEDNAMNTFLVQKLCSRWGIQPDIVMNGAEAVARTEANMYDVILMDIHMPVLDGYEATKRIRNLTDPEKAHIHIIALTASVAHNLSDKIHEAGMNDYVLKPFDSDDLYNKLKAISNQLP